MIVDGCFLMEVMRATHLYGKNTADYAPNDPIFSYHGVVNVVPYIRRDMLMLENQLPLLLLQKLVAVESSKPPANADAINRMVLRFLSSSPPRLPPSAGATLGLHALDVHRRNMFYGHYQNPPRYWRDVPETDIIPSAVELYEAGIRFKKSYSVSLHDIRFRHGVLYMPAGTVDDSTEYMFLNMMAGCTSAPAGNDVTAYVFFMDNIIDSAKDVALLSTSGIIQNAIGSDKAVAELFNSISKDVVIELDSALDAMQREVNAYCRKPWNIWRANLKHTYFRAPTSFINFLAAATGLVVTVISTRLHVGASNDVTAYIFFMDNKINSENDVALLSFKGIIHNAVGSDNAVARLFNSISKDTVLEPDSTQNAVHQEVSAYCPRTWNMWCANLNHTYFRAPNSFINFLAAVTILVMTIMQTVYTSLLFYKQLSGNT
ncbi:LOW QUALITY PROTEIN: hypothetical protein U9M48_002275 [Paspalum notatum var. saurae]|uniref:Uncharacterized protein n=1 Tax=Paspalum notatum var. saurae TaxID=547442 RepID=A0AAQ3PQK6_PASNO